MTFILNVLNKDFSLLAADKLAKSDGPTKMTIGNITINSEKGVTINGFQKIYRNKPNLLAVGIAGTTQSHGYLSDIQNGQEIDQGLQAIRQHMESFLNINNRKEVLEKQERMENQGLATFFDSETSTYFTNLYLFSDLHNYTRLYSHPNTNCRLFHVGSGSNKFEQAVGLAEINKFAGSISGLDKIQDCLAWLKEAYIKVSEIDSGVGSEFTAVISTRDKPEFCAIEHG